MFYGRLVILILPVLFLATRGTNGVADVRTLLRRRLDDFSCYEMEQTTRHVPQGATTHSFGKAVAIDSANRRAVIGAPDEEVDGETQGGAAYILTKDNADNWIQHSRLQSHPMPSTMELFGSSVAIEGNVVAVGAPFGLDDRYGTVQVFQYVPVNNTWEWTQTLVDIALSTYFGSSLSLSGDTLVAAARWGIGIYLLVNGIFEPQSIRLFGGFVSYQVAVDGDTLVIGSPTQGSNNSGSAVVYTRSSQGWDREQQLVAENLTDFSYFGASVAVNRDTIAVGATDALDQEDGRRGAAYVYTRDDNGNWNSQGKLLWPANGTVTNDNLGVSVSIVGDQLLVGAPLHSTTMDPSRNTTGRAFLFQRDQNGEWIECQTLTMANNTDDSEFGQAVALGKDNSALVGASFGEGAAYFFQGSSFPEPTSVPTRSPEPTLEPVNPLGACTEDKACRYFLGRKGAKMHRRRLGRCRNKCVLVAFSKLRMAFGWTCGTCED